MTLRMRYAIAATIARGQSSDTLLRYSEVDELRRQLQASFPHAQSALPPLPPKSILCESAFRSSFHAGL